MTDKQINSLIEIYINLPQYIYYNKKTNEMILFTSFQVLISCHYDFDLIYIGKL